MSLTKKMARMGGWAGILASVVAIAGPIAAAPESDRVFFHSHTERCFVSAIAVADWNTVRIDLRPSIGIKPCRLTLGETVDTFDEMLSAYDQIEDRAPHSSIMLGPIRHYGWLRNFLRTTAEQDIDWSKEAGTPVAETTLTYVNRVLSDPAVISVFNSATQTSDRRFTDISCEKILVSEDGLPFDAFCWIWMPE